MIANALDSCTRQTLSEIEIIVVDDASTDDTVAIVRERAAADGRIRLITHEANRSAFQSRRDGVRAATAPHLMFLDGDDELVADAAAVALGHAQETGAELVQFGIDVVRPDGTTGEGSRTGCSLDCATPVARTSCADSSPSANSPRVSCGASCTPPACSSMPTRPRRPTSFCRG